jgi:hypothetical protein
MKPLTTNWDLIRIDDISIRDRDVFIILVVLKRVYMFKREIIREYVYGRLFTLIKT